MAVRALSDTNTSVFLVSTTSTPMVRRSLGASFLAMRKHHVLLPEAAGADGSGGPFPPCPGSSTILRDRALPAGGRPAAPLHVQHEAVRVGHQRGVVAARMLEVQHHPHHVGLELGEPDPPHQAVADLHAAEPRRQTGRGQVHVDPRRKALLRRRRQGLHREPHPAGEVEDHPRVVGRGEVTHAREARCARLRGRRANAAQQQQRRQQPRQPGPRLASVTSPSSTFKRLQGG